MQTVNRVLREGTSSPLINLPFYILCGIFLAVAALLPEAPDPARAAIAVTGATIAVWGYAQTKSLRYLITPKHIEFHEGILSRDISDISLQQIDQVNCHQSFMMGLVGLGNIELVQYGGRRVVLPAVENALYMREWIRSLVEERREFLSTSKFP